MFERFTGRARQVVVLAQDEARAFGHDRVGTEHLLLGLTREDEGVVARLLLEAATSNEKVREGILRLVSGRARDSDGARDSDRLARREAGRRKGEASGAAAGTARAAPSRSALSPRRSAPRSVSSSAG